MRYADRRLLDDTILPTTIISSYDEAESIFEVFLRLNTGGVKLQNQEIRSAVYHGEFSDLLHNLNLDENWRSVYGEISQKMRDVELILRFFALYFYRANYKAPMRSFLNDYMSVNRQLSVQSSNQLKNIFCNTIKIAHKSIGEKAFRPHKILNASVFDSVMVGLACRLERGEIKDYEVLPDQYERLLANPDFIESTSKNTANEKKVQSRITLAKEAFESVV